MYDLNLKGINWKQQAQKKDDDQSEPSEQNVLALLKYIKIEDCCQFDFLDDFTLIAASCAYMTNDGKVYKYKRTDLYNLEWT